LATSTEATIASVGNPPLISRSRAGACTTAPGGGRSLPEPVSGGQFPGNREKNREYCRFSTISTKTAGVNVNIIRVLPDNCLRIGAGNIIVRTGNWFSRNRDLLVRICRAARARLTGVPLATRELICREQKFDSKLHASRMLRRRHHSQKLAHDRFIKRGLGQ
jgi:hypothetical protein